MSELPSVSQHYAEFHRYFQAGDNEKAYKSINKILQIDPNDEKAFHCKVVCLIQKSDFDTALNFIRKNSSLGSSLYFERAYCEYRLNQTEESLKTLLSAPDKDVRIKELLGQVYYRLEDYEKCRDVYINLIKNTQDDYEDEREANLAAALAAMQISTEDEVEDLELRTDTYDLLYNNACYLIGRKQYEAALKQLTLAEEQCRETLQDDPDVTVDEIEAELGHIHVQRGYVLQKLGRPEEAMKYYNQALKQKADKEHKDEALTAVACNNVVSLNKDQNVFDSKKKIKSATADSLKHKLTTHQRKTIAMNQCLLYMYTNQGDQCKKMSIDLQKKYPESDMPTLIGAAQCHKIKNYEEAVELLKNQITSSSGTSVTLKLSLAQIYLGQGHIYQVCDTLKDLGELSYKPGVISALVSLYMSQEDFDMTAEILNEAYHWYESNKPGSADHINITRANANFHLKHGDPKVATEMLESLRKKNHQDPRLIAQLISAYSKFDPKKAELVSKQLPSTIEITADIDVDSLEQSACHLGPKYIKKSAKGEQSPKPASPNAGEINITIVKKKKKKKKGKLPKNLDPDNPTPIDPERWLPRRERSYYKGKRRDKRKDIGKGTQGSSTAPTAELDASKSTTVEDTLPKTATTPQPSIATPPIGPRQQKPAGAANKQKKKKGKGGKW